MANELVNLRVSVYVEGTSDKYALENLLWDLLRELLETKKISVKFHHLDGKHFLLSRVPSRAVSWLVDDPNRIVVAMPDLYPRDEAFPHSTAEELRDRLLERFKQHIKKWGYPDDPELTRRFKVFCFKHEMEVLLLAAKESLKRRLGAEKLRVSWTTPVEDQNFDKPPKKVIEKLFSKHHKKYISKSDAPAILKNCDYRVIADRCSQCFKPFVDFLSNLPDY